MEDSKCNLNNYRENYLYMRIHTQKQRRYARTVMTYMTTLLSH